MSGLREPRALPMWIITTCKRESLRCLSYRHWTVPYDSLDQSWLAPLADAEPVAGLLSAERNEALLAGLAELPARQRALLLLLVEDPPLSYAQISRRTGIPRQHRTSPRPRSGAAPQTVAVGDHLSGSARAPMVSDGDARLDRATARNSDQA